jgi:hypothetical protein
MRLGFAILVLVWVSYASAATAFLQLGGVQKMLGAGDVQIGFRRAWSFWPGEVHAEDFRLVAQDSNVQFEIDIPKLNTHVALLALAKRTFYATSVRGEGLTFRFRHRVNPPVQNPMVVSAYPPVLGMDDPPLRAAGVPTPPVDPEHYRLWTVHLESVDVGVREVWAQMARFQGQARVRGRFQLRPALHLWIGPPAELAFQSGTITVGPYEVFRDWRGTLSATVDPFDVNSLEGMKVFQRISARATLSAQVAALDVIEMFTGPKWSLADASGALDVDVGLDRGVLTSDSSVRMRAVHLAVTEGDRRLSVRGQILFSAGGADAYASTDPRVNEPKDAGHVALELPVASVSLERDPYGPLELRDAAGAISTTSLDVTEKWQLAGALARVEKAELDDLRWIRADRRRGEPVFSIDGGSARARAALSVTRGRGLEASLAANFEQARGSWKASKWEANGSARFATDGQPAGRAELDGKRLFGQTIAELNGGVELRDVRFSSGDRNVEAWWADVRVSRARLDVAHGLDGAARVDAKLRDGLPVLYLLASEDDIPHIVPALLPLENVTVGLDVDHRCRFTDVRIVQATGGPLAAEGRLQLERGETRGAVLIHTAPTALLSMGLELRGDSSHMAPFAGGAWLAERLAPLGPIADEKHRTVCPPSPVAKR